MIIADLGTQNGVVVDIVHRDWNVYYHYTLDKAITSQMNVE